VQCASLTGTAWSPNITAAAATNHNATTTVAQSTQTATSTVIGMGQAAPASVETSFTVDMNTDLGAYGSLTLVAKVKDYPSGLVGGAYPLLVSLSDGTNEYIHLARTGAGGDCAANGYFTCASGVCSANTSCTISAPSAYVDRNHWEQHQAPNVSAVGSPSTNTFPTCNWTGGTGGSLTNPNCAFNSTFFPGAYSPPRLRYGVSYTAKYVLVGDSYASLSNRSATIELTVIKKTTAATTGDAAGAVDFNVFLVGDKNVQASRTAKGKQNLDTMLSAVADYFSQANANIKLGAVHSVEWTCALGGNTYSDLEVTKLGSALTSGSALSPAGTEGKAINIFLVSTITDDEGSDGFTILGFDGAIGGPPLNSTATSGLTVATFDYLDKYNTDCDSSLAICPLSKQDSDFQETGVVVAHEIGHFFGLNHLSESSGTEHDSINDTPICTATVHSGSGYYITLNQCLNSDTNLFPPSTGQTCNAACAAYNSTNGTFCPAAVECSFNHLMWWTTKNFHPASGNGDGNILSANTGIVLNYHPVTQ
jgi:hypothetical protein